MHVCCLSFASRSPLRWSPSFCLEPFVLKQNRHWRRTMLCWYICRGKRHNRALSLRRIHSIHAQRSSPDTLPVSTTLTLQEFTSAPAFVSTLAGAPINSHRPTAVSHLQHSCLRQRTERLPQHSRAGPPLKPKPPRSRTIHACISTDRPEHGDSSRTTGPSSSMTAQRAHGFQW